MRPTRRARLPLPAGEGGVRENAGFNSTAHPLGRADLALPPPPAAAYLPPCTANQNHPRPARSNIQLRQLFVGLCSVRLLRVKSDYHYQSLMQTVRGRLDVIAQLKASVADNFSRAESAAFQGRKVVEATAFACLIAIENGLSTVPKDARGKWNAEDILKSLKKKGLEVLPSPSTIREATVAEQKDAGVKAIIEGVPERRLTHEDLISIYQRIHRWTHELNPYTQVEHEVYYANHATALWEDLNRLERFLERHFISISGKGFYCTLRDSQDGKTKVLPLEK